MTQSQVVQPAGDYHHYIADTVLPVAHSVLDDPAALHAGHRVLDPHFLARNTLVLGFLRIGEFATTWLLGRLLYLDTRDGKSLEAPILVQHAARW